MEYISLLLLQDSYNFFTQTKNKWRWTIKILDVIGTSFNGEQHDKLPEIANITSNKTMGDIFIKLPRCIKNAW